MTVYTAYYRDSDKAVVEAYRIYLAIRQFPPLLNDYK